MTNGPVAGAYGARASEYAGQLGTMDAVAESDLHLVRSWARSLVGPVIDVGCGPGHWTAYLHGQGVNISGVDPTREFVDHARATYPGVNFTDGCAERLDVPDKTLDGVLAWYSLVHSTPEQVSEALIEFARALRPGAGRPHCCGWLRGDRVTHSYGLGFPSTRGNRGDPLALTGWPTRMAQTEGLRLRHS